MEVPLTPLEFARRTRALYPDREAVVDGALRFTYEQFFERCDRVVGGLQRLGVKRGDRVAYIAPNTHAQLESFYAVPQIGAVLVPINYRLSPEEFAYIINHSGATRRLRARGLSRVSWTRPRRSCRASALRRARRASAPDWLDYETLVAGASADFERPEIGETRSADDQLHQRHDVAAQGRDDHASQRLHERGRHAAAPADEPDRPLPVDAADVPRQRLDVHLDGDGGRRGARLPAQGRAARRCSS